MYTPQTTQRPSDYYLPLLTTLSNDDKLDIIAKLIASMRPSEHKNSHKHDIRTCFSGSWDNEKSTTEVADELRNSRFFDPDRYIEW